MPTQFYATYNCVYCWRCDFSLSLASIFEYLTINHAKIVQIESAVIVEGRTTNAKMLCYGRVAASLSHLSIMQQIFIKPIVTFIQRIFRNCRQTFVHGREWENSIPVPSRSPPYGIYTISDLKQQWQERERRQLRKITFLVRFLLLCKGH